VSKSWCGSRFDLQNVKEIKMFRYIGSLAEGADDS
jgi:hypothetical protein